MSPSHFCPAVLLNVTSGSDTPPTIAPVLTVLMFLYGDRWGGGGSHNGVMAVGGICIRRAAPSAVYPMARNKKVEGHSLPVGRKHFVTAQNNMPLERKKTL